MLGEGGALQEGAGSASVGEIETAYLGLVS